MYFSHCDKCPSVEDHLLGSVAKDFCFIFEFIPVLTEHKPTKGFLWSRSLNCDWRKTAIPDSSATAIDLTPFRRRIPLRILAELQFIFWIY